jgi:DNA repair exonuclease SbcCD nuclease subunit
MKILFVGDVHAKVDDLDDCRALSGLIFDVCRNHNPEMVVYLGDIFDAHAIKHVEVEKFWIDHFGVYRTMAQPPNKVIVLVGNHDRGGNSVSTAHSLQSLGWCGVVVVDKPYVDSGILFLPYYHDPEELVRAARSSPDAGLLVCHASFEGGKMDNGHPIEANAFYGKDVVCPDDLPQPLVISGHIHTPARFGKIWYPGSPRWMTQNDANISRAIWLVDYNDPDGYGAKAFSTNSVCRRVWQLDFTPEDRCEKELALIGPLDKVLLNIRGPLAFCEESKRNLQANGYRAKTFVTDRVAAKVAESKGVPAAFEQHFTDYRPKYGTSKEVLRSMIRERLSV